MTYSTKFDVGALAREVQVDLASGKFGNSPNQGALRALRNSGLHSADIEAECRDLQEFLKQKQRIYGAYGVTQDNGSLPVPVDMEGSSAFPNSWQVKPARKDELLDGMARALERFLDVRASYGGGGARSLSSSRNRPMLRFLVSTQQHYGRVHHAPAFFISLRHVFGSPTSPVYGVLNPGSYVFGVEYPGQQFAWDSGTYSVPPDHRADLQI